MEAGIMWFVVGAFFWVLGYFTGRIDQSKKQLDDIKDELHTKALIREAKKAKDGAA